MFTAPVPRFVAVLFLSLQLLTAQNLITTRAGSFRVLSSSVIPASTASISPSGIAAAPNGDVYFGDRETNVVYRLSSGGLTVVAGNGQAGFSGDGGLATQASLNQPWGLAIDKVGNLYIGDVQNARVRKVDASGVITTVAGNGQSGFSGDGGPAINASFGWGQTTFTTNGGALPAQYSGGIAVDSNGVLYIADFGNSRVRQVGLNGTITTVAGTGSTQASGDGGAATSAGVPFPSGVVVDSQGNLFIASSAGKIREVNLSGTITTAYTAQLTNCCVALAVDRNDTIYGTGLGELVVQFLPSGQVTVAGSAATVPGSQLGFGVNFYGDGGPATSAKLAFPFGLAVDNSGNIFVADTFNERIRLINQQGIITTAAGTGAPNFFGDGGPAAGAGLSLAKQLVSGSNVLADPSGAVYIADTSNGRIRRVDPSGAITTFADFTGSQYLGIRTPYSIARTPNGSFLVAEFGNPAIVQIGVDGSVATIAGTGSVTPADGVPAASAKFSGVLGLACDPAGNIYLLDGTTLRKIDANGSVRNFVAGITSQVVATDKSGNVLVAGSGAIQSISPGGTVTSIPLPQASQVTGLTADSAGNIYVSDSGNHCRILKIAAGGAVTVYAGDNQYGYSGDGGPATQAALWAPTGLTVDPAGNLYIGDTYNDRVREVVAAASLGFSPHLLLFTAVSEGAAPAAQGLNLSSNVADLGFSASTNMSWLSVSPSNGGVPAVLQVTADPTGLAPGTYQGFVQIVTPSANIAPADVPVTFTVAAAPVAALGIDTQNISFAATQGSGALTQQLHVLDTGGGSLSFTSNATTASGGSWLTISPAADTATPSSPASLTVTATPGSLTPGTYSGMIAITGAGSTIDVPVALSVSAPTAVILVSQSAFSFTAVAQGGVPLPGSFGILNIGQGTMSWNAAATTLSGGNWLQISPSTGTVQQPFLDVSLVNVSIDPSNLAAGTYYGQIQVSAVAANTPQVITVIVRVLPAGFSLGPQLFPAGLIFTGAAGVTPGSQDVLVGNPTGTAISYQSGIIGTNFSFSPTNASVAPNQPATLRVYPDFSSVTAGSIQRGTITLQFSDGSPSQTINVLMVAAPSGAIPASEGEHVPGDTTEPLAASSCASQSLQIVFRSLQPNFTAVVAQPTTLDVAVSDGCGNLVGSGATVGAVLSNGDSSVPMNSIGGGIWQGTWKPLNAAPSVVMHVAAYLQQGDLGVVGAASLSGTVSPPAPTVPTPTVTSVYLASGQGGAPITPGGLITIYGTNLAEPNPQTPSLPFPQQVNGTQVLLGNQPLPFLYVSPGQLNVQVPYTAPVNTQYQLTVQYGNSLSVPQQLVVAPAQPGIFTVNEQGTGQGIIVNQNQVTLAQPGTPASIGDTVTIYCTGLGAVSPTVTAGAPAPSAPPLSTTVNTVTVTIGGQAAEVSFSGLTPGFAGLYQINAVVPSGITTGDAVPVVVRVAGQTSPVVTMAVQ
jgi:trimeric autotransporter adhesin